MSKRRESSDCCYLYIVCTKRDGVLDGPVKVGITNNWQSRIKVIQTGCPYPVEYAFVFNAPNKEIARYLEHAFHTVKADRRLAGEWFDIDPISAIQIMCINIKVALEKRLPGWTAEQRKVAFDLTRAPEALEFVEKVRASAEDRGTVH